MNKLQMVRFQAMLLSLRPEMAYQDPAYCVKKSEGLVDRILELTPEEGPKPSPKVKKEPVLRKPSH